MRKNLSLFRSSYSELKKVICIAVLGLLGALSIVLGYFTYMPTETIKITFNFLPNEFAYFLFGPVVGAIYGAAIDILTFIIKPTGPFFFGFTLSAILTGVIYGTILYKRPISLKRIIIAKLIHLLTISLILNTFWLTILYGNGFIMLLPIRALKALILLPVEVTLLSLLLKTANVTGIIRIVKEDFT